jgi:hypothetical protein
MQHAQRCGGIAWGLINRHWARRPCESRHGPRTCLLTAGLAGHDGSAMDASKAFGGDPNAACHPPSPPDGGRDPGEASSGWQAAGVSPVCSTCWQGRPRAEYNVAVCLSDMQQRTNKTHKDAASIRRVRAARSAKQRGETIERLAYWRGRDREG